MGRTLWQGILFVIAFTMLAGRHAGAFSISAAGVLTRGSMPIPYGFADGVHERITDAAIFLVTPNAPNLLALEIEHGNEYTDVNHIDTPRFHFDISAATLGVPSVTNGGFEAGFDLLRLELNTALDAARASNGRFTHPIHVYFRDIVTDLIMTAGALATNGDCLTEAACPTAALTSVAWAAEGALPVLLPNPSPDPDRTALVGAFINALDALVGRHCRPGGLLGKRCFARLEDQSNDKTFRDEAAYLRTLLDEIRAYVGWQALGHAFHLVQDFFAHSNYVELAAGKAGPPCPDQMPATSSASCDSAVIAVGTWLPAPTEDILDINVESFLKGISLPRIVDILSRSGATQRLETGYALLSDLEHCPVLGDGPPTAGMNYCHAGNSLAIGLNKDEPFRKSGDPVSHKNFEAARDVATRVSARLWEAFIRTLGDSSLTTLPLARSLVAEVGTADLLKPGLPGQIFVHLADQKTGAVFKEFPVTVDGQPIGNTEQWISLTPHPSRHPQTCFGTGVCLTTLALPTGSVRVGNGYQDVSFTVPVVLPDLTVSVEPSTIAEGTAMLKVRAVDPATGEPRLADVYLDGVKIGQTGDSLTTTFKGHRVKVPTPREIDDGASTSDDVPYVGGGFKPSPIVRPVPSTTTTFGHLIYDGEPRVVPPVLWVAVPGVSDKAVPYTFVPALCQGECRSTTDPNRN